MKIILKFIGIGFFFLGVLGCESRLEIDTQQRIDGSQALSTEQNISALLIGTYLKSGQAATHGGRFQIMADLLGTQDEVFWNGVIQDPIQLIRKQIFVNNVFVENSWANAYGVINQSNLILDNLTVVTSSEERKSQIEGEARFLRALNYFDLVRFWSLPYDPLNSNTQLGVPLRDKGITNILQDLSIPRASVEEIYQFLINDLTIAYALLPNTNEAFADKYAAQALLARVYLEKKDYAKARDAANDVIENSGHFLQPTFPTAFNLDVDAPETIFAFQVTDQSGINDLNTFYAAEDNGGRGSEGDIIITQEYINLFTDPWDIRGSFFVANPIGAPLTAKYVMQFADISLLRLAEMYLIRAEGNLRESTSVGAPPLEDLNTIRNRAEATILDGPITVDDILLERQLELAFEGFLLHDLKRTGKGVGAIPADDSSLVLPIPQGEMNTNDLIIQNPGYN